MNKSYVERNFGKRFINNLVKMKESNLIVDEKEISGKIYLPFNPHFFVMVHCNCDIKKNFHISYLEESDIASVNHKISYSTLSNNDYNAINKCLDEEKRHITNTKNEILNHDIGTLITKETCNQLLSEIGNIDKVRYIVLNNKKIVLTCINEKLNNYSYVKSHLTKNINQGLKSMLVMPAVDNELVQLGNTILFRLIMNPPDSFFGISIVVDAPECNKAMLNVKRPGVLRQYYGLDVKQIDCTTIQRVAYRSHTSIRSEGSDPLKLIIKPFPNEMAEMAQFFNKFLIVNKK